VLARCLYDRPNSSSLQVLFAFTYLARPGGDVRRRACSYDVIDEFSRIIVRRELLRRRVTDDAWTDGRHRRRLVPGVPDHPRRRRQRRTVELAER